VAAVAICPLLAVLIDTGALVAVQDRFVAVQDVATIIRTFPDSGCWATDAARWKNTMSPPQLRPRE